MCSPLRTILVHYMNKCTDLVTSKIWGSPIPVRQRHHAKKLCGATTLIILNFAVAFSYAQAPIRDRSESATPVEGARRAADVAGNALAAAESRSKLASERHKKAEAALTEAQSELEAARRESASASAEVTKARKADAEARAALGKVLESRGK
jgi:hypothetical protein